MTILLSGLVGGGIVGMVSGSDGAWRETVGRVTAFVGNRFAEVWDDDAARGRLSESTARELDVELRLVDVHGETLGRYGPSCPEEAAQWPIPVTREGRTVGRIDACFAEGPGHRGAAGLGLVAALLVLWAASGAIAWRLTRPLAELVRVTTEIGRGRLQTRAELPRDPGELGVLASAIDDMAGRIEKQIADQRELLAVVSHEIRTPLGHMRVLLDLARDGGGGDPATLDELEQELLEVDRLVDQLLASSRLDFDQLDRRPLRAEALAARALARAGQHEDKLEVRTDDTAFEGDPTLLGRALANLIENAAAHGGGLVTLRVRRRDGRLAFEAEDAGPGLDPTLRGRVFDSFVRGGEGGKLGLGLALVQRIAVAHGGEAYAENSDGGGARVGFSVANRAVDGPSRVD